MHGGGKLTNRILKGKQRMKNFNARISVSWLFTTAKRTLVLALFGALILTAFAQQASAQVIINEIYGGGGNGGASFNRDYVELVNRGATSVDIAGYSIQYAAAGGTTYTVASFATATDTVIEPNTFFLVQLGTTNVNVGAVLPSPDATPNNINASATAGKIALVSNTTPITGACPTDAAIVDFVGYGAAASCAEPRPSTTTQAPAGSSTTSIQRNSGVDNNVNSTDFTARAPNPRGAAAPTAASVSIGGRILAADGSGISRARVTATDANGDSQTVLSNSFGYYRFAELAAGENYVFNVSRKGYNFQPQTATVAQSIENYDFVAQP